MKQKKRDKDKPTLVSRMLYAQIRLIKPLLEKMDIAADRAGQDKLGELGAKALEGRILYVPEPFDGFEAEWARPAEGERGAAILYLHGGGYTAGSLTYAKGFGGMLCDATRLPTLCVGYRLAPEHPFPAALDDAVAAYERILTLYPADKITVAGESAGGGLSFALCLRLRELSLPLPACIVGVSPWSDLTLSGASVTENEKKDPSLFKRSLAYYAELYAGDDIKNPLVSPVFGDFTGFPPSLVFAGSLEILRDDAAALCDRLQAAGAECTLVTEEGMWHVYVLYGVPEAKRALSQIREFIDEYV